MTVRTLAPAVVPEMKFALLTSELKVISNQ